MRLRLFRYWKWGHSRENSNWTGNTRAIINSNKEILNEVYSLDNFYNKNLYDHLILFKIEKKSRLNNDDLCKWGK